MYKISLILLFTFVSKSFTYSQKKVEGFVISKTTNEKIPHATIALLKANSGVNANDSGYFALNVINTSDTLIISSIGYKTIKLDVTTLLNKKINYELDIDTKLISEVVIQSKRKYKEEIELNKFSNCSSNYYTSSGTITQIAQKFSSQIENSLLSSIEICKLRGETLFRIRIYDIDPVKKSPSYDLLDTIIEVKTKSRKCFINLEDYKIIIPTKEFFVAIEWIKIQSQVKYDKLFNKSDAYTTFSPYISFETIEPQSFEANTNSSWAKNYNGRWTQFSMPNYKFLISATLKY